MKGFNRQKRISIGKTAKRGDNPDSSFAVFAMAANPGGLCDYVNGGTKKGRASYSCCCAGKK